jgi:hypothetical protein
VSLVNLSQFIAARGYTFFLGAIYLMFAGLLVAVGLSIWVAQQFQANRFDHVWWVNQGKGGQEHTWPCHDGSTIAVIGLTA